MRLNTLTTGERIDIIWPSYRIPTKFTNARFDNYYPRNKDQQEALQKCCDFAKQDLEAILEGNGLFLHGPVGTGKTHLAVSSVHEIAAQNADKFGYKVNDSESMFYEESKLMYQYPGRLVGFINVTDLLTTLQESYSGEERAKIKAVNMLHRAKVDDIVILDDLGAMKPSAWVETQLYNLIDIRYRMQRPMIFTSNCKIKEIEEQVGPRIVSRILEVTEGIHVIGPDYRKKKLA